MKKIIYIGILLLLSVFFYGSSDIFAVESVINSSRNAFEKLGVILTEDSANAYFVGDTILIRGRVTDKKEYALVYIENVQSGEDVSELAHTDSNGNFQIPVTLPNVVGKYYFIVASGNSFTSSLPQYITLVPKTNLSSIESNTQSISPVIVYDRNMPYLFFGQDMWADMQLEQSGKIYNRSGKIISLNNLPLTTGNAKISIKGNYLSSVSSLDQIPGLNFSWVKNIFIDRTREIAGKELVALRTKNSVMTMDFIVKKGEELYSNYYVTNPDGSVNKFKFDQVYIDNSGFLKTGIRIQQSFAIPNNGVYKIETVRSNGLAYFNIPVSKNTFWSIVAPLSEKQTTTLRSDKRVVDRSVLKSINIIRSKLRKPPLVIDITLSEL
ncbi:carboxypeptidase-like regulatory domain-containing protein, partial [Candidatus Gracilibacteria bacterium]|nr:carboxypeptidase-like regulatory domain-containing protein [Candidatus Gracilibacteria bacterium]